MKQNQQMKYPIYIPSKGRFKTRHTIKALHKMNIPFFVVVEPAEFEKYERFVERSSILVLPRDDMKLIGARNWIKAHSIKHGHLKHWQLDDNITKFSRLNNNLQIEVTTDGIFRAAEDFCDRYENIAFAGFQYDFFAVSRAAHPAFAVNRRIYSCTLVDNNFNFAWRSIYNDDTDVCLRALKNGLCTILFYAFIQHKAPTMTVSGGNTEDLYLIENGRKKMAEALAELHPDVASVKEIFNRPQHYVDYRAFKNNKLISKIDLSEITRRTNNYGMILTDISTKEKKTAPK